jgi:glycine cleavage system aminomethyltransferase T
MLADPEARPTTGREFGFRPSGRISPFFERADAAGAGNYHRHFNSYIAYDYAGAEDDQYHALRNAVTLSDVSVLRPVQLKGPDALAFADYLSTRNIASMEAGRSTYSFLCDAEGMVVADPVVLLLDEETVWFVISLVDLLLWIKGIHIASGFDASVREVDAPPLQLQGPRAVDVLERLTDCDVRSMKPFRCMRARVAGFDAVISTTGFSGEQSFEIYLVGAPPYPAGRRMANALWDAILDAGTEFGLCVTPVMFDRALESSYSTFNHGQGECICALEFWRPSIVDFSGGDFIGRTALQAIRDQGGPPRRLVGLQDIETGKKIIPGEWEMVVLDGNVPVGTCRRAGHSPTLDRGIALGRLDREAAVEGARYHLPHADGVATVEVVRLPFV